MHTGKKREYSVNPSIVDYLENTRAILLLASTPNNNYFIRCYTFIVYCSLIDYRYYVQSLQTKLINTV